MKQLFDKLRAEFALIGQKLNYLQATLIAYLVMYPSAPREIVNAIVPVEWRPLAAAIAAFVSFVIVRLAANRDAKKAAGNG